MVPAGISTKPRVAHLSNDNSVNIYLLLDYIIY